MNTETGEIKKMEAVLKLPLGEQRKYVPCKIEPTERQMNRKQARILDNEKCLCGSGQKFKNCCKTEVKNEG